MSGRGVAILCSSLRLDEWGCELGHLTIQFSALLGGFFDDDHEYMDLFSFSFWKRSNKGWCLLWRSRQQLGSQGMGLLFDLFSQVELAGRYM